jgi:HK97 gp10 family phage protein
MATVEGIDKLQRRLVERIPKAVRAVLEAEMAERADAIVRDARLRVPVDHGDVRDSIHRGSVKVGKKGGLYVAISAGDARTRTTSGGVAYQVARLLEFGTVKMPAQPFLLPAFRLNRRSAKAGMRKVIVKAITWA